MAAIIPRRKFRGAIIFDHDGVLQTNSRSTTLFAEHHNEGDVRSLLDEFRREYSRKFNVEHYITLWSQNRGKKNIETIGDLGDFVTFVRHEMRDEDRYGRKDTVKWKNKILKGLSIRNLKNIIYQHGVLPQDAPDVLKDLYNDGWAIIVASNSIQPAIDATCRKIRNLGGPEITYRKANNVVLISPEGEEVEYQNLRQSAHMLSGKVIPYNRTEHIEELLRKLKVDYADVIVVDDTPLDTIGLKVRKNGGYFIGFAPPLARKTADYTSKFKDENIPVILKESFEQIHYTAKKRQVPESLYRYS
ncbi:MAG: hypothetical protein GXO64_04535 [Candidatus Micrarchaeota archaeon]|nr:hypothetical protein [Candidatus Micrarchaeota archaeon]